MRKSTLWLMAAAATACHGARPRAVADSASVSAADEVTLERFPCRTGCAVYTVSIDGTGIVAFNGIDHVVRRGAQTARVPSDTASSLLKLAARVFERISVSRYAIGTAQCGNYIADLPEVALTVRRQGMTTRVFVDFGCENVPSELRALVNRIDDTANVVRWIDGVSTGISLDHAESESR